MGINGIFGSLLDKGINYCQEMKGLVENWNHSRLLVLEYDFQEI